MVIYDVLANDGDNTTNPLHPEYVSPTYGRYWSSNETNPNNAWSYYFNRGYYYYQQGDLTRALADYQQARALGRNDIYLLSNLGWTAYLLGDYETAVEASSQAAELAPNRPDLAFNKALHLLAAGRYDEAKETYDKAIQLTLQYDDALVRSRYFGAAYYDLQELAARRPDLQPIISEIQEKIDIANG